MPCPTCGDEEMTFLAADDSLRVYHCWRCGTDVITSDPPTVLIPRLVEQCREFYARWGGLEFEKQWRHFGIADSIHPPEDRP